MEEVANNLGTLSEAEDSLASIRSSLLLRYHSCNGGGAQVMQLLGQGSKEDSTLSLHRNVVIGLQGRITRLEGMNESLENRKDKQIEALESEVTALKLDLENAKKDKTTATITLDGFKIVGNASHLFENCEVDLDTFLDKQAEIRGMEKVADRLHLDGMYQANKMIDELIKQEKKSCP